MNVGEKIKIARKNAGLTQKELGEKLGVKQQTIAMFENNKTNMKMSTLCKIADALDCEVCVLSDESFSTRTKLTASINRKANDMILGKVEEICNINGTIYNYEINEKFVVEAIGKATPKNVIIKGITGHYSCPTCGRIIESVHDYCWHCGQKIDWESED